MKWNPSTYNPFPEIISLTEAYTDKKYDMPFVEAVLKEINKGGIYPETAEELDTMLNVLLDMRII